VSRWGKADILVNDAASYPDGILLDMPADAGAGSSTWTLTGPIFAAAVRAPPEDRVRLRDRRLPRRGHGRPAAGSPRLAFAGRRRQPGFM